MGLTRKGKRRFAEDRFPINVPKNLYKIRKKKFYVDGKAKKNQIARMEIMDEIGIARVD
jgi:hypothetical protein